MAIEGRDERYRALPVERLSHLLGVGRRTLYHHRHTESDVEAERNATALRDRIEEIVLESPAYGYRRVTAQLHREDWWVNHKRVLRVMREESLLCHIQRRWVPTTDSEHGLAVYPNLIKGYEPQDLDEVWQADITYIRLPREFCYLSTVLDAFSRRVVGWHLARYLDARLSVAALKMALNNRKPRPGFIHHSDRGVQYACQDYVETLIEAGARISMSGTGKPRDNAKAESFFRTLKMEEVYLQDYESFLEADARIKHFIEAVYNRKRLHSSLGYVPPVEFEEAWRAQQAKAQDTIQALDRRESAAGLETIYISSTDGAFAPQEADSALRSAFQPT
jgi:putative transposase